MMILRKSGIQRCFSALLFAAMATLLLAQAPAVQWQNSLGGSQNDVGVSMDLYSGGGYITASQTNSNNYDVVGNHGGYDIWVVKFTTSGAVEWKRCLGGTGEEYIGAIQQTTDGGYILTASTSSNVGDFSGNHGESDLWVVKLDATGQTTWQHVYGGSGVESARTIEQAADGGYYLAGSSASNDGDASGSHGSLDFWVLRLDSMGEIQWQHMLGGSGYDSLGGMRTTADGGCIVIGSVGDVADGDITEGFGGNDIWVAKLDPFGELEWQRSYGGSNLDFGRDIALNSNGGYILAGATASMDHDVSVNHGSFDFWVVHINSTGEIEWEKTFGGSGDDEAVAICNTPDAGFALVGYTGSLDGQVSGYHGGFHDAWGIKVNSIGDLIWEKSFGGSDVDHLLDVRPTSDGGFAMVGFSNSSDGDLTTNHGESDLWFVKLGPDITGIAEQPNEAMFSVYPNPTVGTVHVTGNFQQGSSVSFSVLSAIGQTVLSQTYPAGTFGPGNAWSFDASALVPGVYLVRLLSEGQLYTRQFIRQ